MYPPVECVGQQSKGSDIPRSSIPLPGIRNSYTIDDGRELVLCPDGTASERSRDGESWNIFMSKQIIIP